MASRKEIWRGSELNFPLGTPPVNPSWVIEVGIVTCTADPADVLVV
jgi:hypothetical protein